MFVFSVKTSKTKLVAAACALALAATGAVCFFTRSEPVVKDSGISLLASNAQERAAFISQFGWEVSDDPTEVAEIIIPSEFDATYSDYNAVQLEQGLNLEPYKGLRAKRWTYDVLNYPGYEGRQGVVQINLLVYDGAVIGGDVCSLELGGFLQGFDFPEVRTTAQSAEQSSVPPAAN